MDNSAMTYCNMNNSLSGLLPILASAAQHRGDNNEKVAGRGDSSVINNSNMLL